MGTRADFYIGRGAEAEWIGSCAFDGYPDSILDGRHLGSSATPEEFRAAFQDEIACEDHATVPEEGWPWPWDDSGTTDYAYALDESRVWVSCFGGPWKTVAQALHPDEEEDEAPKGPKVVFPNMKERQNVTLGKRSGILIFGA